MAFNFDFSNPFGNAPRDPNSPGLQPYQQRISQGTPTADDLNQYASANSLAMNGPQQTTQSQATTGQTQTPNSFPTGYLNPYPINNQLTNMMVNQANAGTAAGAQQQAMDTRANAASRGFGAGSGATAGSLNNVFSGAAGQQAQNQFQIPMAVSNFNTAMQQAAAQLGSQGQNTTDKFLTGQAGNQADALKNFLSLIGGLTPNVGG